MAYHTVIHTYRARVYHDTPFTQHGKTSCALSLLVDNPRAEADHSTCQREPRLLCHWCPTLSNLFPLSKIPSILDCNLGFSDIIDTKQLNIKWRGRLSVRGLQTSSVDMR